MDTQSRNYLDSMVQMRSETASSEQFSDEASNEAPNVQVLQGLASGAEQTLRTLTHGGEELSRALETRLDDLQESFMAQLHSQLAAGRLNLEDRLHLSLSPEGRLVVEGSENDADKLCELISRKPALQQRFQELSRLAMLSHGVEVVRQAHNALTDVNIDAADNPLFSRYHICLKGSLSHFYVR